MGIQGLLPAIQSSIIPRHISYFAGKCVAVDGYAWLHKGVYGCSTDLANGTENNSWINYCLKFIDLLLNYHIRVIMVFDGSNLPQKSITENLRSLKRQQSKEKGIALTSQGNKASARSYFCNSIDVTPLMAAQLIQFLKKYRPNVQYIVAPYEADAQLASLSIDNHIDAVIAEDSDTIPYKCKQVIFKLNINGHCQHLVYEDIYKNRHVSNNTESTNLEPLIDTNVSGTNNSSIKTASNSSTKSANSCWDLSGWSPDMLLMMCIASGCDYLVLNCYKLYK
jgi:exonuclease-1